MKKTTDYVLIPRIYEGRYCDAYCRGYKDCGYGLACELYDESLPNEEKVEGWTMTVRCAGCLADPGVPDKPFSK